MNDNFEIIESNDIEISNVNEIEASSIDIKSQSFDQVSDIFNAEKGGATIEKELKEFKDLSSGNQKELNKNIDKKIGFGLEDLEGDKGAFEDIEKSENKVEEEKAVKPENPNDLEDYMGSAEFIIFLLELIIVWGTNFHLKKKGLEKVTIEAFKKSQRETKLMVRAFAKILHKYNKQITIEVELAFCIITTYGMKVKGIIREQEEKEKLKNSSKPTVKPIRKTKKKTQEKNHKQGEAIEEVLMLEETEVTEEKKDNKKETKPKERKKIDWRLQDSGNLIESK